MMILGIETTAHTFGVGIVTDKGDVLANVKDSFTTQHSGMIPAEVAEHHFEHWESVLDDALDKAKLRLEDIDLFAFSQGPGIGNCLRVGTFIARCLALEYNKPLIGVNHCIAHLAIGELRTKARDPVLLYASGANTQVIAFEGKKYREEELAFSIQETVFAMLVEVAERAMAHTGKKDLVLGGGVACNARLQEMCRIMCSARSAHLFVPEKEFLVDNGAMIAWLGWLMYRSGVWIGITEAGIKPYQRT